MSAPSLVTVSVLGGRLSGSVPHHEVRPRFASAREAACSAAPPPRATERSVAPSSSATVS